MKVVEKTRCPNCGRQVASVFIQCPNCNIYIQAPELKEGYVSAFIHLMLHKLGGSEELTLQQLEKFPTCDAAKFYWDVDRQAFVLSNSGVKKETKRVLTLN